MEIVEPNEGEIFDIELDEDLLRKNRELADNNRQLLDKHGVQAIDVLGSIGSGKTSLVMQLVSRLKGYRIAAIAGDLTTTIDAQRIREWGANVIQINTGRECHLDANMVRKAISKLDLDNVELLFIENVGNLICPADFPLGSHKRVVVISVTEGPYMILKHPFIFMDADVVAINKIDLCQEMKVNPDELKKQVLDVKSNITVAKTNCRTGEGIDRVIEALGL